MSERVSYFRLFLLSVIAYVAWTFWSNDNESSSRLGGRAPSVTVANVPSACKTKGQIALTFGEGPMPRTATILSTLAKTGIKTTFHIEFGLLKTKPETIGLVKQAHREGHNIGLHFPGYTTANDMSDSEVRDLLKDITKQTIELTGITPKYFRFNYEDYTDRNVQLATELGFIVTKWNIDTRDDEDWTLMDYDITKDFRTAFDAVPNGAGSFIARVSDIAQIFDIPSPNSPVERIKAAAVSKGYTFVTLDQCLADPTSLTTAATTGTANSTKPGSPDKSTVTSYGFTLVPDMIQYFCAAFLALIFNNYC